MSQLQSFTVSKGDFSETCDCRAAGGWPVPSYAYLLPRLKDGRSPKPTLAVLWSPATAQHVPCGRAHANWRAISGGRRRGSAVQGTWLRSWAWLSEQAPQPAQAGWGMGGHGAAGTRWGCKASTGPSRCHVTCWAVALHWAGLQGAEVAAASLGEKCGAIHFRERWKSRRGAAWLLPQHPRERRRRMVASSLEETQVKPRLLTPSFLLLPSVIWTLLPLFFPPSLLIEMKQNIHTTPHNENAVGLLVAISANKCSLVSYLLEYVLVRG